MTKRTRQDDLHLTDDEILDLVNDEASEEVREWWGIHRQHCQKCVEAFEMTKAVAMREAQMPLVQLTPDEERSVLARITDAIVAKSRVPEKQPGTFVAFLNKVRQEWQVASFLPADMASRGGTDHPEEDGAVLVITDDGSGNPCLRIALGEDYAGATVRVTGEGVEEISAVLNPEGAATLVLPAIGDRKLSLWLIEES